MTAEQLRAILDWRMSSDPWPGGDVTVVDDWLDGVCREGGYQNWVDAYHSLIGAPEIFQGTLDAMRNVDDFCNQVSKRTSEATIEYEEQYMQWHTRLTGAAK